MYKCGEENSKLNRKQIRYINIKLAKDTDYLSKTIANETTSSTMVSKLQYEGNMQKNTYKLFFCKQTFKICRNAQHNKNMSMYTYC